MKKGLLTAGVVTIAIITLLFFAPWLSVEGGEQVVENFVSNMTEEQRAEMDAAGELYACREGFMGDDCCDGISSSWAPFGRKVGYCNYASWYVPFWGN